MRGFGSTQSAQIILSATMMAWSLLAMGFCAAQTRDYVDPKTSERIATNWNYAPEFNSLRATHPNYSESASFESPNIQYGTEIQWQFGVGSLTKLIPELVDPSDSTNSNQPATYAGSLMLTPMHPDPMVRQTSLIESADTPKFGLEKPADEFLIVEELQPRQDETPPTNQSEETAETSQTQEPDKDDRTLIPESASKTKQEESAATIETLRKTIERRRSELNADEEADATLKSARIESLAKASSFAQQAAQFNAKASQFAAQLEDYGDKDKRDELNRLLKEVMEPRKPIIDKNTTTESLTTELQDLEQEREALQAGLNNLNKNMNDLNDRVSKIPGLKDEAAEELADIKSKLSMFEGTEDIEIQLKGLTLTARLLATEAKIEMLDKESQRQGLAGKILPLQRDLETRKIAKLSAEISRWESAITDLRKTEVEEQKLRAEVEKKSAHPALKSMAQRNEELAKLRDSITDRLLAATNEATRVKDDVKRVVDSRTTLEDNIQAGAGMTTANGMLLVEHRRNLIAPWESLERISAIETESKKMNIAVLQLEEERTPLANPTEFVQAQLDSPDQIAVVTDDLKEMGLKFAETQRQYLDALIADYNLYRSKLREVAVEREKLVSKISSLKEFIDQNALWIQSSEPMRLSDVQAFKTGMVAFFDGKKWSELGSQLRSRIKKRPHESALGVIGLLMLMLFTRRLKHYKTESPSTT